MNGEGLAADDSSPDHVTKDWYSVPELRLRDHRFKVPLDHSLGPHSSPKITVFAREVVAGNISQSQLFFQSFSLGLIDCIRCFFVALDFLFAWRLSDNEKFCFLVLIVLICGAKTGILMVANESM